MTHDRQPTEERLPFDPRTVILGLWKRRLHMVVWIAAALGLGAVGAYAFGFRVWDAEAVLLYQPPAEQLTGGMYSAPSIKTQLHMVAVEQNLAETRLRLNLEAPLASIGKAIDVENPRDSHLLVIRATWRNPRTAARIADTLCDVFVTRQAQIRRRELSMTLRDLESRLNVVKSEMRSAGVRDSNLSPEEQRHLHERETEHLRSKLSSIDVMYERAVADRLAAETELVEVTRIIEEVKDRVANEKASAEEVANLSNLNIQAERLRDSIHDDRSKRVHDIRLEQWRKRLDHSRMLFEKGYLSQEEFDFELSEFEKSKVVAVDTDQIKQWKSELDSLYQKIQPRAESRTASAPILHDLMVRRYHTQLERAGAERRCQQLDVLRKRMRDRFDSFVEGGGNVTASEEQVVAWHRERRDLEQTLAKVRAVYEADESNFGVVSETAVPGRPSRSYGKLFFVAIAGIASLLGCGLLLGVELADTRIKSATDLALRIGLPVLGSLPDQSDGCTLADGEEEGPLFDPVRLVARRLRTAVPDKGACVLVVSAEPGEGRTMLASHLAACFGEQGEQVLLVDGQLRRHENDGPDLRTLLEDQTRDRAGLGDFLSGRAENVDDVVAATRLKGVRCLPRSESPVTPDLIRSRRMRELLVELLADGDLVLIDGPPSMRRADDELLAEQVDAIVLVVESHRCTAGALRKVIERLETLATPIVGVVLNRVQVPYHNV